MEPGVHEASRCFCCSAICCRLHRWHMQLRAIRKRHSLRAAARMGSTSASCGCPFARMLRTPVERFCRRPGSARIARAFRSAHLRLTPPTSGFLQKEAFDTSACLHLSTSRIGQPRDRSIPPLLTANAALQQTSSSPEFMTKTVAELATERWREHASLDPTYGASRVLFACQT